MVACLVSRFYFGFGVSGKVDVQILLRALALGDDAEKTGQDGPGLRQADCYHGTKDGRLPLHYTSIENNCADELRYRPGVDSLETCPKFSRHPVIVLGAVVPPMPT